MIDQSYCLPCDRHAVLNYVRKVGLSKTMLQLCAGVKPQSLATVRNEADLQLHDCRVLILSSRRSHGNL
jgi:hypothetical protein